MEAQLDNAPCCYFSFRDNGIIQTVNNTLCENIGYSKGEVEGQKAEVFFTLATKIFYQTHFFPLLRLQNHAEEIYITLQSKTKEHVPILINASRNNDDGEALNICVGIVVHNRKKFEDELINAKKKMELAIQENTELTRIREDLQKHSERLDETLFRVKNQNTELKQFNRVVTHDLQEPIRKLTFFGNQLLDDLGELPGSVPVKINRLIKISEQMRSIVSGLQQYVWLNENAPAFESVDLNKILSTVQHDLEKEFDASTWKITADQLPPIDGDKEQLRLLFHFLITNAIKFKKEESIAIIKISSTVLMQNSFRFIHQRYKYTDYLKLEITDNGMGFDQAFKDQMFELFKKLHHGSGMGLGLALSKKIVENHHGIIEAEGVAGAGASITIYLPLHHAQQTS